ncbi:hypothetical protein EUGRSUZ_F00423 [Eucalyptus grandis]|uniref:Uncharacterized protein n=2 Tax=Eucalyptus grandis TaxID=71139 RepID=A0ACC3KBP5_EUCGR|nr:hypothetical protein EUGRSUZ_F00423 [Eucalyptus grandis]
MEAFDGRGRQGFALTNCKRSKSLKNLCLDEASAKPPISCHPSSFDEGSAKSPYLGPSNYSTVRKLER